MGYRVGIDLGTTFSAVAYINPETGKPEIIKNQYGNSTTPSVLAFNEDGSVLFGQDAKDEKSMGNPNTASFFKRDMGNPKAEYEYCGKVYTPKDLSSIFLKKLIAQAEERLGEKVDEAVITVPAYFTNVEKSATLQAGIEAGIKVSGIISEPSAAAFAYGLNSQGQKTVLIYDLGGGTFDVSIAEITDEDINIIGTAGEHQLGGKDWDAAIVSWLERCFEEEFGYEIEDDLETDAKVMEIAEKAKKELSLKNSAIVRFSQNGMKGQYELTRETFKDITDYQLSITKNIIDGLFRDIGEERNGIFSWEDIDGVILVGGSTKMHMVEEYIMEQLHQEPLKGVNVDEAVALGAAIRANIDETGNVLPGTLKPVLDKLGGRKRVRDKIAGGKRISDTIAHSLGMVAENEKGTAYVNSILIKKNSSIPIEETKTHMLYTTNGKENELEVYLLQGDDKNPVECLVVGKYVFHGIKHESGGAKIAVTYRYNKNGIIEVEARQNKQALTMTMESIPEDMGWLGEPPRREARAVGADIYLMIDMSYSMEGKPIREVEKMIRSFLDDLDFSTMRIAMIGVANEAEVFQKLTNDKSKFRRCVDELEDDVEHGRVGFGNAAEPFSKLLELVADERKKNSEEERKVFGVVLADGIWNGKAETDSYIYSKMCHAEGIEIIALGFGSANEDFLKKIASANMKDLSALRDLNQLAEDFSKIARVIGGGIKG